MVGGHEDDDPLLRAHRPQPVDQIEQAGQCHLRLPWGLLELVVLLVAATGEDHVVFRLFL